MPRADRSRYFELAHRYVDIAVRNGDLPKLDGSVACTDCREPATEYDHRDYKKPMEVEPVCRACNQARGPGLHRDPSETGTKPPTILERFYGPRVRRPKPQRSSWDRRVGSRNPERDAAILAAWESGQTQASIGARFGISGARVNQIVARLAKSEPVVRRRSHH